MPMGMGFEETLLMLLVFVVIFGSTRLPGAGDLLGRWLRGEDPRRAPFRVRGRGRWKPVDWLLLSTTLALAAAMAISLTPRH